MPTRTRKAASDADRLVCRECKLPIQGAADRRAAVWLAIGPMHAACNQALRERIAAEHERAIADGTHSDGPALQVCGGCRTWQEKYHVTFDGKHLCKGCTPLDDVPVNVRAAEAARREAKR